LGETSDPADGKRRREALTRAVELFTDPDAEKHMSAADRDLRAKIEALH